MSNPAPLVYWFRQDLRLADNAGLAAAVATGRPLIPLYIHDTGADTRPWGGASRWWLHHSLARLAASLGGALVLRRGPAQQVLDEVLRETGAAGVMWGRCYEPFAIARDSAIKKALLAAGRIAASHNTGLLFEPWDVQNKSGKPFQVFTPFWKHCLASPAQPPTPLPAPGPFTTAPAHSETLESWQLLPTTPDWTGGLCTSWTPGEAGARARLAAFLDEPINGYKLKRDLPGAAHTSRLSPHLHWGEISPRQIWHAVQVAEAAGKVQNESDSAHFLSELGWREFSHHLLYHFPTLPHEPLNRKFAAFPWSPQAGDLAAWQRGRTGYPIVDAGMRELWHTGWMHNRVRMIAGSFLVKDLLIPWQQGEAWFWDTLVDADLANNSASWQWIAGCGADAAPYFRVFNPVLQGEKFDPAGHYIRRHVPELAALPERYIHRPWEAPADVLRRAGVALGHTYPQPLVDHHAARNRALAAFATLRENENA